MTSSITATIHQRLIVNRNPTGLWESFVAGLGAKTRECYAQALNAVAEWLGVATAAEAATWLVSREQGELNQSVFEFIGWCQRRGLSPATINLRRAAIKSVLQAGRMFGFCLTTLEVKRVRQEQYRDTAGPGADKLQELFQDLTYKATAGNRKAIRDLAIARLMYNRALRKAEALGLDLKHYDRPACRLSIHGKARASREWVTLPQPALEALDKWLAIRGKAPGPLFVGLHDNGTNAGKRLCDRQVNRILESYGIRPHGLRHAAITKVLEITGGDVTKVQKFSRHKALQTVMIYDDRRQDLGGQVASMLDSAVSVTPPAAIEEADFAKLTAKQADFLRAAIRLGSCTAAEKAIGAITGQYHVRAICRQIPQARAFMVAPGLMKGDTSDQQER